MQIDNVEQSTCKSPVFRLYYQGKTGPGPCKFAAAALFFGLFVPCFRVVLQGCRRR